MWRSKLIELYKEQHATKGLTQKSLSDLSGVSVDTISRLLSPTYISKEGPGIENVISICNAFGIEPWELFYTGDKTFVAVQAELIAVRTERDTLALENAVLKSENDRLHTKVDTLRDEIIDAHKSYHKIINTLNSKQ